jgi:hypothetical protein
MKRVRLYLRNIFGEPYTMDGRIVDEKTHGYNLPSGGWALYSNSSLDTTAEFYVFIEKGKRKKKVINKINVHGVEEL